MKQSNSARIRYFDYLEKKGKMPKPPQEDEMHGVDDESIKPEDDFDYEMGHASDYDSSGEPHTDHDLEDERPMEFMSRGGMVKRMYKGGHVPNPRFAKALRRTG